MRLPFPLLASVSLPPAIVLGALALTDVAGVGTTALNLGAIAAAIAVVFSVHREDLKTFKGELQVERDRCDTQLDDLRRSQQQHREDAITRHAELLTHLNRLSPVPAPFPVNAPSPDKK